MDWASPNIAVDVYSNKMCIENKSGTKETDHSVCWGLRFCDFHGLYTFLHFMHSLLFFFFLILRKAYLFKIYKTPVCMMICL